MKRTIALISVIAMLLSFAIPVSALSVSEVPAVAGMASAAEAELLSLPETAVPMTAETLDEALNAPGGTMEFLTYDQPEFATYAWVVEEDWAKSSNQGLAPEDGSAFDATQSQVKTYLDIEEGQAIQFRFKLSCQDEPGTDWFGLFVNRSLVQVWYGEEDWTTVTIPIAEGYNLEFAWVYSKDGAVNGGQDTAWLDDVEVVECDHYELVRDESLNEALNVPGGNLDFYTVREAGSGYFPWTAEGGAARSTNEGVDATTYQLSMSILETSVNVQEGDVFHFRYKVSSEKDYDWLRFYVDGDRVDRWSGEIDWSVYFYDLTPGLHTLRWEYTKDKGASGGEDMAWLDDVYLGEPERVTGVALQETAFVPGCRSTQLSWNVFPETAADTAVTFTSSDETVATVDANGVVTGVSLGQAVITVTTNDGGFTDTCLVSVTAAQPAADIHGFLYAKVSGSWYSMVMSWCSFQDTNPADVELYGRMPMTDTGYDSAQVLCAELVDDTVYGYTGEGYFFSVKLNDIKTGELNDWDELEGYVTYLETNATGLSDFYPTEMSYDYSTGTMYVINYLTTLYEVDLETGDLKLETGVVLDGEVPDGGESASFYANAFAIDLEGNAYIMLSGFGANWGGNGCSRLASLDLATGEYTVIGQTTAQCFQEQTMCFDHNTGKLYWAQVASAYKPDMMSFYIVDTETAELTECGKIAGQGAWMAGLFVPMCAHETLQHIEARTSTCTAPGNVEYWQCTDCGKCWLDGNKVEEIPVEDVTLPAAHGETELRGAKDATCTEDGYTGDLVCKLCGEVFEKGEIISATGHGEAELRDAKEASCTEDGYTGDKVCPVCGEVLEAGETVEALGHDWSAWTVTKEATANISGEKTRTCSRCGETESEIIPATGGSDPWVPVLPVIPSTNTTKPTEPMPFADVSKGDWFYDAVKYVYEEGLMNGTGETRFSPNATLTRAMVVTILYRMEGEPTGRYNGMFTDVPNYQWYTDGVEWAAKNGIVNGYGNGKFGPEDPVTREQLAAILYRYAQSKGYDVMASADLGSAKVSAYAVPAVKWAVETGILSAANSGLRPGEAATRAEVALAVAEFHRQYVK